MFLCDIDAVLCHHWQLHATAAAVLRVVCAATQSTNASPAGRQLHRLQWRLRLRVCCSFELLPVALLPEAAAAILLAGLAAAAAGALLRGC